MTSLHCSDNSPLSWRLTANSFTSVLIARQCSDTTLLFCITCHKYLDIYAFDLTFHYCPDISPPSKTSDHFWHLVTVLTNSPLFWRLSPVLTLSHVRPDISSRSWQLSTVLTSHHCSDLSPPSWHLNKSLKSHYSPVHLSSFPLPPLRLRRPLFF